MDSMAPEIPRRRLKKVLRMVPDRITTRNSDGGLNSPMTYGTHCLDDEKTVVSLFGTSRLFRSYTCLLDERWNSALWMTKNEGEDVCFERNDVTMTDVTMTDVTMTIGEQSILSGGS